MFYSTHTIHYFVYFVAFIYQKFAKQGSIIVVNAFQNQIESILVTTIEGYIVFDICHIKSKMLSKTV